MISDQPTFEHPSSDQPGSDRAPIPHDDSVVISQVSPAGSVSHGAPYATGGQPDMMTTDHDVPASQPMPSDSLPSFAHDPTSPPASADDGPAGVDCTPGEGEMDDGVVAVPPQVQKGEFDSFGRRVIQTENGPMVEVDGVFQPQRRGRGRPRKGEIVANTAGRRGVPGRPPGERAAMLEFRARLLSSPKSLRVLESIFDAALNDDHKNQAAAWKLIVDRLAPLSTFEKGGSGKSQITINIGGLTDMPSIEGEVLDES